MLIVLWREPESNGRLQQIQVYFIHTYYNHEPMRAVCSPAFSTGTQWGLLSAFVWVRVREEDLCETVGTYIYDQVWDDPKKDIQIRCHYG
jgi:hypothetical protein